jgi:hypothetical protein
LNNSSFFCVCRQTTLNKVAMYVKFGRDSFFKKLRQMSK